MKKNVIFVIFFLLAMPLLAGALSFESGQSFFKLVSSRGNNYIAGGNVSISEDVSGDLSVAGGQLSLSGNVAGDGKVAGGNVLVNNSIEGDLAIAGGEVNFGQNSTVGGDLIAAGGRFVVNGMINGDVVIAGGDIYINGRVAGDVYLRAGKVQLGRDAFIGGDLNYSAPQEAEVEDGATIAGEANFTLSEGGTGIDWSRIFWIWTGLKFLAFLVTALALYFLFGRRLDVFIAESAGRFWVNVLRGIILLAVVPLIVFLLFVTVIGLILGFMSLALYLVAMLFASVFAVFVVAGLINNWRSVGRLTWTSVVLGAVIIELIGLIPVAGWIINLFFFSAAFGAIFYFLYKRGHSDVPAV